METFFNKDNYTSTLDVYKEKSVIWIRFPYDLQLIKDLKCKTKPKWSSTHKCWCVLDNNSNRDLFGLENKIVGKSVILRISAVNEKAFQDFTDQLKLKSFSRNTIKTYAVEFAQLLYILKDHPVEKLSAERLKTYFLFCVNEQNISDNHLHSRINAIKFYFEKVLHREKMFFDIPRPKKPQLLPKSLNTEEIKKMIALTENPKHRLIIQLAYGMGLRVSEIVNLKIADIDSVSMRVLIDQAKGKKDRYVNLPAVILNDLRSYYKIYKPARYLFEGQSGDRYSVRSAQSVFKNAIKKAGIIKNVGIHSLRHSYATHLLEYGTDISLIQKLLGHNSIKTTLNYTRVTDQFISKVESPLDRL